MQRPSTIFIGITCLLAMILAGIFTDASLKARSSRNLVAENQAIVRQLELTDLSIFTEASYTRHPSMTDMFTPFQDSPSSLEHFPTGGLMGPPPHLVRRHGQMD